MKRLIGLLLIHSTNVGESPSSPLDTCRKANRDYHKKVLTVVERFINA